MSNDQRHLSRRIILDAIRKSKRIARIDLAQSTNISQATITTVTADMIRQGLIEETEPLEPIAEVRRGRPRVDLQLRGDAHFVAGLKISDRTISAVLVNFEGQVLREHKQQLEDGHQPAKDVIIEIENTLTTLLKDSPASLDTLSAIGIGIAGVVDASAGFVHWSPFFEERNIEFGPMLSVALGKPVFLDNDANLVAMAEHYFGDGRSVTDFIVVTIENGVGLGIVLNNKLYRGARGAGAEFGHMKVQLDGALCRCGQRGCLEAYISDYALLREASTIEDRDQSLSPEKRIQNLLNASRAGDATAQSIVNRSSRMFAMGLSNLVNLFDPQLIILSGERMQFDHLYAEEVIASIQDSIVQVDAAPPQFVIHKWGDFMWARGAAAFALDGVADLALGETAQYAV